MGYWIMEANIYRAHYEHVEACWILNTYRNLINITCFFLSEYFFFYFENTPGFRYSELAVPEKGPHVIKGNDVINTRIRQLNSKANVNTIAKLPKSFLDG